MTRPALALFCLVAAAAACTPAPKPLSTVHYACAQGKALTASYFDGPTRTAADGRPIPGGRVELVLPDGRSLSLPQTLSGSGIRYANADQSFVFWSKGDSAFVEEGPQATMTFRDCVARK
ncbi:MliC family protein [Reyranella sp.]|uniref:MliC family protein n=1 Tax=Reyranella sp. TaxID=1929291 RepID=UPI003BABDB39